MKFILPLIKYYDLLFQSAQGDSVIRSFNEKEMKLFKAVRNGSVVTDVHASKLLYDGNPSGQAYAKFKQVLYEKLIKMSINLEVTEGDEYLYKRFKLLREWHAIRLLSNLSATQLTRNLEKKVLIRAERMKIYDIAASISHNLSSDYKILDKKDKEGTYYWEKYQQYRSLEDMRIHAKNEYANIAKHTRKKHVNEELSAKAKEAADRLLPMIQDKNVHAFRYYYQLRYMQYILVGQHKKIIVNNLEAVNYFEEYFKNYEANETLRIQIAISYFNLNMHDIALTYLDENVNPIGKRWLIHVSLRARAYFSKEEFDRASKFISRVLAHPAFKEGRAVFQEQVWLFKYYSDLMVGIEKGEAIVTRRIKNNLTRIRVDKKGMNIPLLFADIVNEVLKKGISYIYEEQEKLEMYYKAHVKPSKNLRAALFMKFLIMLPDYNYNKSNFKAKLARLFDRYQDNPMKDVVQPDNEIVNYEILISKMLDQFCPAVKNDFKGIALSFEVEEAIV